MNLGALVLLLMLAGSLAGQVTFDRLLHADREPQNWLTYSGGYSSHRYSLLTQVTPDNVKRAAAGGSALYVFGLAD